MTVKVLLLYLTKRGDIMNDVFNLILSAIGSVGFPIVVAVYMIWTNQKQAENHKSEVKEMTQALNDLRVVIQQLSDKIED